MNFPQVGLKRWRDLCLGRLQPVDEAQRRHARLLQTVTTGLAGRGVNVLVSFLSLPLAVGYLGTERYGMWVTITTMLAWLNIADLGLGNSLTNALANAYGKGDNRGAQNAVASAFWMLTGVAAGLLLAGGLVWIAIDWPRVFSLTSEQARLEAAPAVAVAGTIFLLGFPLSIVGRILQGYQEGAIANYWGMAGNLASFVGLIVVTQMKAGLVLLVVAVAGFQLVVAAASGLWLFIHHKPWLTPRFSAATRDGIRHLGLVGGQFFMVAFNGLLLFQTDNLIIAHFLGASAVTPYNVTWRLFNYATILPAMFSGALWPAYAEAFARNDGAWIRRTFRKNLAFALVTTALLSGVLLLMGRWFIGKWAGPVAIPPFNLVVWMALWTLINAAMGACASLANGLGHLRGQMIYGLAAALLNLPLAIFLVQRFGITGVTAATVLAFLTCVVVPISMEIRSVLKKLSG